MKIKGEGLVRSIGVWGLSANIVNIIIGAGIFVIPALVAENMGANSLVAYLFCGILIALIMLCFAEAGSKVPRSGGGYAYVEEAFGPFPAFLTAIFYLLGGVLADASVSNALVDIAAGLFPFLKETLWRIIFLFLIFGTLSFINIVGIKQGIGLVKLLTIGKLIPLLILICLGWKDVAFSNLAWDGFPTLKQLGETSLLLFFAFQGGDVGLSVGGEIKKPKKNIPRAIFIGISGVIVIYMLIQTVTQGVLGNQLQNFQEAPLAETARVVFGPVGFGLLFIGAAISMTGMLSGEILNNPRVLFAVSKDRVIPTGLFARIHPRFLTPYLAIFFYSLTGFFIAIFGGFKVLVSIASACVLLTYLGVSLAVIRLRKIKKSSPKEYTIPGGITVPVLSAIIILYFLSNLQRYEIIGFVVLLIILSLIFISMKILDKRVRKVKSKRNA
ncbi:amino acid permease [Christiangramia fulva]|uniref:Amino acid permease n=1 Tax=Christiangramia fulva TaxID=2126553 RepID=A0A2R3Z575_9FLAO|nr:APC family permease [Christiangramia fulva]AVR45388.1 amino acid permease [Christiangramia fulva]